MNNNCSRCSDCDDCDDCDDCTSCVDCIRCINCTHCDDCTSCRDCNGCVGLLGAVDAMNIDMRNLLTDEQWRAVETVFLASGMRPADVLVDKLAAPYRASRSWLRRYLENYT